MTVKTHLAKLFHRPEWVNYPTTLQLDTHNYCNLNCQYCNVQHSFNLPHGTMPLNTIKQILTYWRGKGPRQVAPFMNGEPLLDKRLPKICSLAEQKGFTCIIDTNGTLYEHRKRLIHSNLKVVRFTISAVTADTYKQVHGKPFFDKAVATFEWFLKHKLPTQQLRLHFICTRDNEHEVAEWSHRFQGTPQTIFPVHRGFCKRNSRASQGKLQTSYMVTAKGQKRQINPPPTSSLVPCPCWTILPISWRGDIMQCVDFPYHYSYGRVDKTDMSKAWRQRNLNKMNNPCCNTCNLRFPQYKQIMEKYVK